MFESPVIKKVFENDLTSKIWIYHIFYNSRRYVRELLWVNSKRYRSSTLGDYIVKTHSVKFYNDKQDGNVPSRRHILGSKIFKEQLLEKFGKKNFFKKKNFDFFSKKVFFRSHNAEKLIKKFMV